MIRFVVLFRSRKKADEDRDRLKKKLKKGIEDGRGSTIRTVVVTDAVRT